MKANELMLRDWVIGCSGEPFQIGEIDPDFIYWDEIKPIPLTPEILEKNGFRKRKGKSNSYVNSESEAAYTCFSIGDYTNLWGGGDQDYVWVTVKYVHQLQHALRLCRIEQEIIL